MDRLRPISINLPASRLRAGRFGTVYLLEMTRKGKSRRRRELRGCPFYCDSCEKILHATPEKAAERVERLQERGYVGSDYLLEHYDAPKAGAGMLVTVINCSGFRSASRNISEAATPSWRLHPDRDHRGRRHDGDSGCEGAWFRNQVQAALDDPRPLIKHEEVKEYFATLRAAARKEHGDDT
jgi:hypothetical protein